MASTYKLTYFPTTGWAEPIRFLLSYGNLDWEDIRIPHDQWPSVKPEMPFGHVPCLEYAGKKAGQSLAICRYVAQQVKLAGNNEWENLEIDAVVDWLKDAASSMTGLRTETDPVKKQALRDKIVNEILPGHLQRVQERVQSNNGFLVLERLTWADIWWASLTPTLDVVTGGDTLKDFPALRSLRDKIFAIPSIKKYIDNRPNQ